MTARSPAKKRVEVIIDLLAQEYPGSPRDLCALCHDDAYQLLVATILSAQTTDERVNLTTPALFCEYPDAAALAAAPLDRLEKLIHATGFFRAKARNLVGMARAVVERYGGEIPSEMADLTSLPGVGRKTANVIRSVGFGLPGLPVDTHVGRLARRLGLSDQQDPVKVEADLDGLVPPEERGALSLRLILHGRRVCTARKPRCDACVLAEVCPSAGTFATITPPATPKRGSPRTRPKPDRAAAAAASQVAKSTGRLDDRSLRAAKWPSR